MNNITIELCTEDRARIDRLADLLERRISQAAHIMRHSEGYEAEPVDLDAVQQKLAEVMAKTSDPVEEPKNAPEATKDETLPTDHPADESLPWEEPTHPDEPTEPTVTLEEIQQKVLKLAAANNGAKKAKVRAIVNAYVAKVSDLKDHPDKWAEVWNKLVALERI